MSANKKMIFVDGSNFLIELSRNVAIPFRAESPPWVAIEIAKNIINSGPYWRDGPVTIRSYWFASYKGNNDEYVHEYSSVLRKNGFEPVLFKRRGDREKGVDIALTKEMLVNAFNHNYDNALLVAGDEDYLGLVQETKRYGPIINGLFFEHGLSKYLKVSFDYFNTININWEESPWKEFKEKLCT